MADRLGHVIPSSFSLQAPLRSTEEAQWTLIGENCLALTGLATPSWAGSTAEAGSTPFVSSFHPLTRLLLDMAQRASIRTEPVNRGRIEGLICRQMSRKDGRKLPL